MALIHTLRVSCEKATALLERRDLQPLSPGERVGLWMHMRICAACRAYEEQSLVIDRMLEQRRAPVGDSSALEERILAELGR